VVPFGCNGCLCGKSKHRSTNPHKERKDRVLEQRDEMVDARAEATAETLGIDLMFEDGLVFLVCVGKVLGYTHLGLTHHCRPVSCQVGRHGIGCTRVSRTRGPVRSAEPSRAC